MDPHAYYEICQLGQMEGPTSSHCSSLFSLHKIHPRNLVRLLSHPILCHLLYCLQESQTDRRRNAGIHDRPSSSGDLLVGDHASGVPGQMTKTVQTVESEGESNESLGGDGEESGPSSKAGSKD
jgi:hypothetical protein